MLTPATRHRNLAYIWQGGLGLPDRDYYLKDTAELAETRKAYAAHIGRMFSLAGWNNAAAAGHHHGDRDAHCRQALECGTEP